MHGWGLWVCQICVQPGQEMFPFMVGAYLCPVGLCSSAGWWDWWRGCGRTSVVGQKSLGYLLSKGAGSTKEWKTARQILVLTLVSPNHLWADVPPWPELIPITSEGIDWKKEEIKTSTVTWKNAIKKLDYGQGNIMHCICCKPEEGFECQEQPAVMF